MSVKVSFDGIIQKAIQDVSPSNIVIRNRNLYVKGNHIPVQIEYVYDVFYYLAEKTSAKHGRVIVNVLRGGGIQFFSRTSNYSIDYYLDRVLGLGSNNPSSDYFPHINKIPRIEECINGNDVI